MLIAKDQEIAGLPAVAARDLMRQMRHNAVTVGVIAEVLALPRADAKERIERLAADGFICRVDPTQRVDLRFTEDEVATWQEAARHEYWATTILGNALAKARIGKRMPRHKAQELLEGVLQRAAAINGDGDSLFTVEEIVLFGSFADRTRDEVGDVDLHVLFDRRVDGDEFIRRALEAAEKADAAGRTFGRYVDRLTFAETQFRRDLKGSSPRLDIQFDDVAHARPLPPGAVTEVVYVRPGRGNDPG